MSRLPVGSSARMIAGSVTIARAIATRCCWPPESSDGQVAWRGRRGRPRRSRRSARSRRSIRPTARVDQRQLDVAQRRGARDQVEALEDEPDLAVADIGELVVVEVADVDAVEQVAAARRDVEAADDVHQRRLAAARRAHDRRRSRPARPRSRRRAARARRPPPRRRSSRRSRAPTAGAPPADPTVPRRSPRRRRSRRLRRGRCPSARSWSTSSRTASWTSCSPRCSASAARRPPRP